MPTTDPEKRRAIRARYRAGHRDELNEYSRQYRAERPVPRRAPDPNKRFRRYGITREIFEEHYDAQEGCCAFCGWQLPLAEACIEHDHETGAFRGLVHRVCNNVIGAAEREDRFIGYMAP